MPFHNLHPRSSPDWCYLVVVLASSYIRGPCYLLDETLHRIITPSLFLVLTLGQFGKYLDRILGKGTTESAKVSRVEDKRRSRLCYDESQFLLHEKPNRVEGRMSGSLGTNIHIHVHKNRIFDWM